MSSFDMLCIWLDGLVVTWLVLEPAMWPFWAHCAYPNAPRYFSDLMVNQVLLFLSLSSNQLCNSVISNTLKWHKLYSEKRGTIITSTIYLILLIPQQKHVQIDLNRQSYTKTATENSTSRCGNKTMRKLYIVINLKHFCHYLCARACIFT